MKNTPSSLGSNIGRLKNTASRVAIAAALIGGTACQTDKGKDQETVSENASISNQQAIDAATKTVNKYLSEGYDKVGIAPRNIVKADVFRLGDDQWEGAYVRATLNYTGDFPAAYSARPENTVVVYLTLESGSGICVALNSRTGEFISMEGDN